jgi:hypothetical protein
MRRALNIADGRNSTGHAKLDPMGSRPGADRPPGDRQRSRFVQDGDVPVTIVSRPKHRDGTDLGAPSINRISAAEAAMASERTARLRAERALHEAHAIIHDLQTKQAHAEFARVEAAATREQALGALRASHLREQTALQEELAAERTQREAAEAKLREAVAARERAEAARDRAEEARERAERAQPMRLAAAAEAKPAPKRLVGPVVKALVTKPVKRAAKTATTPRQPAPKPVKWWIKKTPKA